MNKKFLVIFDGMRKTEQNGKTKDKIRIATTE